jgi:hypothetical protein
MRVAACRSNRRVPSLFRKIAPFTFSDTEVDGPSGPWCEGDGGDLAALASDRQRSMTAFHPEMLNVGVQRLGDPQPVQRQQTGQGMISTSSESSLDQEHAELVAIQSSGVRLIVQPRATHMHRR